MVILPGSGKGLVLTPAFVEFRQGGANTPVPFAIERDSPPKIRWSVNPAVGTISSTGVYAPPTEIPRPGRVIVTAVDETDNKKIAGASVYLLPPGDVVTPWDSTQHDRRTLLFVMIVGMLGTVLGSSRSFANFLGNRQFVPSWGLFYVFRPVFGAGLAALIYFGYRSGAVGGVPGASPNSMATVAFVAGLVGLFADVVLEKLREIVMVAFRPIDSRADKMNATPTSTAGTTTARPMPEIKQIQWLADVNALVILGKNFVPGQTKVLIDDVERSIANPTATQLVVVLDRAGDKTTGGSVEVIIVIPDGTRLEKKGVTLQ